MAFNSSCVPYPSGWASATSPRKAEWPARRPACIRGGGDSALTGACCLPIGPRLAFRLPQRSMSFARSSGGAWSMRSRSARARCDTHSRSRSLRMMSSFLPLSAARLDLLAVLVVQMLQPGGIAVEDGPEAGADGRRLVVDLLVELPQVLLLLGRQLAERLPFLLEAAVLLGVVAPGRGVRWRGLGVVAALADGAGRAGDAGA